MIGVCLPLKCICLCYVGEAVVDGVEVKVFSSVPIGGDACIGWMHGAWKPTIGWMA
ncbi:hypothetical protein AAJP84_05855 [Bartonella schoenbuchensis]|uniref:hypothetical protein n=1 Tax=Bartonella schoenbuchensis TaxID=165694 RepID=UPI0031CCD927